MIATVPPLYETFIAKSRYARYLDSQRRRENWSETTDRYVGFMQNHLLSKHDYTIPADVLEDIRHAINNQEVMPSMRALMTAGKALGRDNTAGYNCFARETEFITDQGIKSFYDFNDGDRVKVLADSFRDATVRKFGTEKLFKLTVQRGARYQEEIYTTANHRWITVDAAQVQNQEVITNELKPGMLLKKFPSKVQYLDRLEPCKVGIMHGMVFGDGSKYYQEDKSSCHIMLCGDSVQFAKLFVTGRIGELKNAGTDSRQLITGLPWSWKDLPSITANKEYLLGFLMGWFGADGCIGRDGTGPSLGNKSKENLTWFRSAAATLGIMTRGIYGGDRQNPFNTDKTTTMFGLMIDQSTLPKTFFLKDWHAAAFAKCKAPDRFGWKVVSIEETERVEDVWCVQVPGVEKFTLSQGIQTKNCSYLPIDDLKAFDEAMYILLCGTGVGFSVERQYVNKLPEIPERVYDSESTIVVSDSKEGWAKALRQVIAMLYSGEAPRWDVSKVRPAGARLKTFGGRASGPGPLVALFEFVVRTFKGAQGRRLNSLECHDIMCKIGEVVVVGGVRRSAMISLSNLSDDRMRHAKSGAWWESQGQRALANNSACYTEKPDVGVFMREWVSLYDSKSGERGIFNREAAQKVVKKNGRRDPNFEFGTNPCCFIGDTMVAVADGRNAVSIADLAAESQGQFSFPVYSAARSNTHNHAGDTGKFKTWKTEVKNAIAKSTGFKPVFLVTLSNGDSFESTDDHPLATQTGSYVEVKDSLGVPLEGFFSTKGKYRRINSLSDGHAYQHRLIWEHANGPLAANHEIDHISNIGGDLLCNLQALPREVHLAKTAEERHGENNPVHRRNVIRTRANQAAATETSNNARWCGLSDQELISIGQRGLSEGVHLSAKSLRTIDERFPLSFSKNRFGGDFATFKAIVNGDVQYTPPTKTDRIEIEPSPHEHLTASVHVVSIEPRGIKEIFDLQVEDNSNFFIITKKFDEKAENSRGILVHNSEIILRPYQFCNLTEIIVRATDTVETLKRKARIASIIGTYQSTMTHFPYLRKVWRDNTEAERLLGVSMTGIFDNAMFTNPDDPKMPAILEAIRDHAVEVNKEFAEILGIPQSAAVTAVKPSGTVSQRVDSASGLHARHAEYYFRRVRADNKDPLTKFMIEAGIPNEPDVTKPSSTTIFTFPKKAPAGALLRKDLTAIQHLKLWLVFQRHYCEHKPSVTVSVSEAEWPAVGAFVWEHFDEMSGVSFLPYDGGSYRQAPYEDCTEKQYLDLLAKLPHDLDWDSIIEIEDNVEGAQMLACTAGGCEI